MITTQLKHLENVAFGQWENSLKIDYSTIGPILRNIRIPHNNTHIILCLDRTRVEYGRTKKVRYPFILLTHSWILIRHLCRSRTKVQSLCGAVMCDRLRIFLLRKPKTREKNWKKKLKSKSKFCAPRGNSNRNGNECAYFMIKNGKIALTGLLNNILTILRIKRTAIARWG